MIHWCSRSLAPEAASQRTLRWLTAGTRRQVRLAQRSPASAWSGLRGDPIEGARQTASSSVAPGTKPAERREGDHVMVVSRYSLIGCLALCALVAGTGPSEAQTSARAAQTAAASGEGA